MRPVPDRRLPAEPGRLERFELCPVRRVTVRRTGCKAAVFAQPDLVESGDLQV
ncbi:hypothetical protein ACIA49_05510 [Kribbella sp. NPDC051587]|uniref:hypothetical protein n=1 Tax=Kribbella sp. NPDC051587 TaxID=3364119 RepID=UPI0037927235